MSNKHCQCIIPSIIQRGEHYGCKLCGKSVPSHIAKKLFSRISSEGVVDVAAEVSAKKQAEEKERALQKTTFRKSIDRESLTATYVITVPMPNNDKYITEQENSGEVDHTFMGLGAFGRIVQHYGGFLMAQGITLVDNGGLKEQVDEMCENTKKGTDIYESEKEH